MPSIAPRPIGWTRTAMPRAMSILRPTASSIRFCYTPAELGSRPPGRTASKPIPGDRRIRLESRDQGSWRSDEPTARARPPLVSEFSIAGLTEGACSSFGVPRVAKAPSSFEMQVSQIVQLQARRQEGAGLAHAREVVPSHIDKA